MFNTIYTGMSGLIGYSKGLQVIGNNLTNVNTPGFKGVDQQFSTLFSEQSLSGGAGEETNAQFGTGLNTLSTRVNFAQGPINQTGNPLDVAVNGLGFFVLRNGAAVSYSRAGQFNFNNDGFLVSQGSDLRVAGLSDSGQLQDISLTGLQTNPGKQTSTIKFGGNLSSNATKDVTIGALNVFDAAGGQHTLSLVLHNNGATTPGSWTVTAQDETGATAGTGTLQFTNGIPAATANSIKITLAPKNMTPVDITLDFSNNVTAVSNGETSSLASASIDGHGEGTLRSETFDATGTLVATYTNGQTAKGPHLALALFDSVDALTEVSGNTFVSKDQAHIGIASSGAFGSISAGVIEGSNVDLSQQFSNLIVMQRGYQAASQVVSTSNDMIQTLLDMRSK